MDFFYDDLQAISVLPDHLKGLPARLAAEANHPTLKRMVTPDKLHIRDGIVVRAQKTYAYSIRPVPDAVQIPEHFLGTLRAIGSEAEVVVPFIAPEFIESYRTVYRFQYAMEGRPFVRNWVTSYFDNDITAFPR
jgi:hypothetical protein